MGQRHALLLTTFLTVFGLVLIGAVALRLTAGEADVNPVESQSTVLTDTLPLTTSAVVSSPDQDAVNALIASREESYQAALQKANEQLQEAYNQLQAQNAAPAAVPVAPAAPAAVNGQTVSAAPTFATSPEQAMSIALSLAPGATVNATPELVNFEGSVAYEVNTSAGLIYVDANTGAVLYNGAAAAPAPTTSAPTTGGGVVVPLPPVEAAPNNPQISADQAVAAALAYTGGGSVERVKLEEEHGAVVYEVRFTNDTKVYVDPVTGQVLFADVKDDSGGNDDNGGDDNGGHGGDDHGDDNGGDDDGDDD